MPRYSLSQLPSMVHWGFRPVQLSIASLKRAEEAIPVFDGPLKDATELVYKILDVAQRVRAAGGACTGLAIRCSRLMVAVLEDVSAGALPQEFTERRILGLIQILRGVADAMGNLLSQKAGFLKWYSRVRDVEETLRAHTSRINETSLTFKMRVPIDVHERITVPALDARVVQTSPQSPHVSPDPEIERVPVYPRVDLKLSNQSTDSSERVSAYHGTLRHRNGKIIPVVIREYSQGKPGRRQMKEEIRQLNELMGNPSLPRVIGRSSGLEQIPYLIVSGCTDMSARSFLKKRIGGGIVQGFMSSLNMMYDVVSAVQYLRKTIGMKKSDLEICTDVVRFNMTAQGNVIIGRDLVTAALRPTSANEDGVDEWLKGECWVIVMGLLYGGSDAIRWDNWETIQTDAPHIRPLLTMATYLNPSFDDMVESFHNLAAELQPHFDAGELKYTDIRDALLKYPDTAPPDYMYKPSKPLDIAVGDVGYICGDKFVKLGSIMPKYRSSIKPIDDYTSTSGPLESTPQPGGIIKHSLKNAQYVEIARWGDSEHLDDLGRCWELYAEVAQSLVSNGVLDSNVRPADLICVRSLGTDYRLGIYKFHQQLGSNPDPPDLEFLEFNDTENSKPVQWIYDASEHDPAQFTMQEERTPQYIGFLQMEEGEYYT